MRRQQILPYMVLFAGVLIASSASILIRLAQGQQSPILPAWLVLPPGDRAPSLVIAAGRLALASLLLAPIALARAGGEIRALSRRSLGLGMAAGLFLALHFAAWIASLEFTSVASSAALVVTNPLWVGLASLILFRERVSRGTLLGIGLTISGTILISVSDSQTGGSNALLGNGLALLGALTVSGYLLIGRRLRQHLSLLAYIWLVYTSAAVVLLLGVWLAGQTLLGYPPQLYLLLLGLALGPQLLGHTAFNWALRYLSATFVAIAVLGEPIGSSVLALVLFGEQVQWLQIGGMALLLAGIAAATLAESVQR